MELFTLPERPNPLFPALKSAFLSPAAFVGVPSLFLLINPALTALEVTASTLSEGYRRPLLTPPPESLLNVLPSMSFGARQLRTFAYTGTTNDEFFHRLLKFTSLQTLRLTLANYVYLGNLSKLRTLEQLHTLEVTVPFLNGQFVDRKVVTKPLLVSNRFDPMKTAHAVASEYDQCILARGLPPRRIRNLRLGFIQAADAIPLHLSLGLYLEANPTMESLVVESVGYSTQEQTSIVSRLQVESRLHYQWPSITEANNLLLSAMEKSEGLRKFHLLDFPLSLAEPTDSVLRESLASCRSLTSFRFRGRLNLTSPAWTVSFVGLSFLASVVRVHCPALEELEYHFSSHQILEEDLILPVKECEDALKSALGYSDYAKGHHPLQKLTINTGLTLAESSKLELPLSRKVQIAQFLDRLFPNLVDVRGSVDTLWSEVDLLVKSYQEQRASFVREVEGLLEKPHPA